MSRFSFLVAINAPMVVWIVSALLIAVRFWYNSYVHRSYRDRVLTYRIDFKRVDKTSYYQCLFLGALIGMVPAVILATILR